MGFILSRNVALVTVLIALTMAATKGDDKPGPDTWTVHIGNKMIDGGGLLVHCKSKNVDLGAQNVTKNQEYEFVIKEDFFQTTLYWCYFRSMEGHAEFNIFWPERRHFWLRDHCDGAHCIWTAKDNGIFLRNNRENTDDYKHDWVDDSS